MFAAAAATSILSLCSSTALADSTADGGAVGSPGVVSGNEIQIPVTVPVNACGNSVDAAAALNPAFGNSCAHTSHQDHGDRHADDDTHSESRGGKHGGSHGGSHSDGGPDDGAGGSHDDHSHHDDGRGGSPHGDAGDGGLPHQTSGHGGHDAYEPSGHGGHDAYEPSDGGGHWYDTSGASASGAAVGSPGVGSGNNAQAPIDVPVNACGNTVDLIGLLNPAFGNDCDNTGGYGDTPPGYGEEPPPPGGEEPPPPGGETPPPGGEQTPPPPGGNTTPPPSGEDKPPSEGRHHGSPPSLAHTGGEAMFGASAASAALIAGGALLYRRGRAASRR